MNSTKPSVAGGCPGEILPERGRLTIAPELRHGFDHAVR
jgi:hypothetical protein